MEVHVKYMLLIYDDEKGWAKLSETQQQQAMGEYLQFTQQLQSAGQYVASAQLRPTLAATSVRAHSGKRLVTDGPFAETREQLLGYYLIDVPDLDAAIAIAARIPGGPTGGVEIRPLLERPLQATP
jgi:hypothetical protein